MYFVSLQGHGTSCWPGASGAPTLCTAGTQDAPRAIASRAGSPMRVIVPMLTTTYGESVTCTPKRAIGEPMGPIAKGTTYIVRPRMAPRMTPSSSARIAAGSRQLLVGPASASSSVQMKVRLSRRATSLSAERARKE